MKLRFAVAFVTLPLGTAGVLGGNCYLDSFGDR